MIKRSFRWLRQPTERLGINWDHPLAEDLVEFGYSLGGENIHSAAQFGRANTPATVGTATPEITRHGHAITVSGTGNYIDLGRNISAPARPATGWVRTRVNSLATGSLLLSTAGVATTYSGHWLSCGTTGALGATYGDGEGAGSPDRRSADSAAGVVVAGEDASFGFVCRSAVNWSLYKNGADLGAPTYSGSAVGYAGGTANGTINYRNASTLYGNQSSSAWAFWSRALTDAELFEFDWQPFAILMPYTRRVWVSAASGVSGTLAVTTADATLSASGTTTVTGTLAVTTADATLAASGTTTVTGTLAVTTADATLVASGTTTVTGTLAVTTADATLAASGAVGNDVTGTLAVTLADATVSASGTTTVVGTLAVTTADASLAASGTTTVTGTLAVTTADATLAASDAIAEAAPQGSGGTYYLPAAPKKKKRPQRPQEKPSSSLVSALDQTDLSEPDAIRLGQTLVESEIAALLHGQMQAELYDDEAAALLLLMAA